MLCATKNCVVDSRNKKLRIKYTSSEVFTWNDTLINFLQKYEYQTWNKKQRDELYPIHVLPNQKFETKIVVICIVQQLLKNTTAFGIGIIEKNPWDKSRFYTCCLGNRALSEFYIWWMVHIIHLWKIYISVRQWKCHKNSTIKVVIILKI